jgi:hypothetical protein
MIHPQRCSKPACARFAAVCQRANVMAFSSPTDTTPLACWTKASMTLRDMVSTLAPAHARAVDVFG